MYKANTNTLSVSKKRKSYIENLLIMMFRKFFKNSMLIITLLCAQLAFTQTTLIPDINFEQALINLGYDSVIDGEVLTATINTIENLNLDNMNISDLTGIQAFDALAHFSCKQNSITTIDFSQNTNLYYIDCGLNQLTSINISQNTALLTLYCSNNSISNLDLSQNLNLKYLICSDNPLINLNVTQNPELYRLFCDNNGLTSLNISQNPLLHTLHCKNNELTNLDFSQNPNLATLLCDDNQLTTLNSGTTSAMAILTCANNQLSQLETGNFINLESLVCDNNNITNLTLNSIWLQLINCSNTLLTMLDLSESNNLSFVECTDNDDLTYIDVRHTLPSTISTLIATNNPNLACIITDDATYNHGENWQYDSLITQVVETESACGIGLDVSEFNALGKAFIYPNPASAYFSIKSLKHVEGVKIYDLSGRLVRSFSHQEVYSVEELPKGVFVIRLQYSNNNATRMLVVE